MFAPFLTKMFATYIVAGLCLAGIAAAQEAEVARARDAATQESSAPAAQVDETTDSVEAAVEETSSNATAERRKSLINDAVEAFDETQGALKALDEGDTETALKSLALATGKLELVVARNPALALAPIDVRTVTHDVYATVDSVKTVKKRAIKLLSDGRLQDARVLIEGLRSEVVVEVVNVPLATYPQAIKAITPLIDADKLEEAKIGLQTALNTLVVTKSIHPLPVIRTKQMLTLAEELAINAERTDEQDEELARLLEGSRQQLELAQILGYGFQEDFKGYYEQLKSITSKTSGGKSGTGLFDKIRRALSSFGDSDSTIG